MRHYVGENIARLEAPRRLPGIDLARGLALIGMFAAHLAFTTPLEWGEPRTWSGIVDGRSSILFATLAGVSLALVTSSAAIEPHREPRRWWGPRTRLALRALFIWALGVLLDGMGVPIYVILPAYGVLFLVSVLLLRLSTQKLFAVALAVALVMPFVVAVIDDAIATSVNPEEVEAFWRLFGWNYPFLLWAAFLAAGLGAGRLLAENIGRAWVLLATGIGFALLGYGVIGPIGNAVTDPDGATTALVGTEPWFLSVLQDQPHASGIGEALGSGGFALAVIAACVLLGRTPLRWLLWPIRAAGSMPLTAYVAHILAWAIWIAIEVENGPIDPWEDFRALEPFWPMTVWIIAGCSLWALLIGKGPLEILLARVTTGPVRAPSGAAPTGSAGG